MKSVNFEFLRPHWPVLAGLGGFAESYSHADPVTALGKLRTFCEESAQSIRDRLHLPKLYRPNPVDLLDDAAFKSAVPTVVITKMHVLRVEGNRAVHGNQGDSTTALRLLKDAHDVSRWMFLTYGCGRLDDCPAFQPPSPPAMVIDVAEDPASIERRRHSVKLAGIEMVVYRERVEQLQRSILDTNPTLQRIRAGQPVAETELESLCSLVLTQDPSLDLRELVEYFPETAGQLDRAIRSVIGLDAEAVSERFTEFVQAHPNLASHQIRFLDMLKNHIAKYGSIEVRRLYEPPFRLLHSDGLDGAFDDPLAEELLQIIGSFRPPGSEKDHTP